MKRVLIAVSLSLALTGCNTDIIKSMDYKTTPQPTYSETPVLLPATVVTREGDIVIIRSTPSRNGAKKGYLYTSEQVDVIAKTNKCETINGIYNCWVKVQDVTGLVGYSFGGYLNY